MILTVFYSAIRIVADRPVAVNSLLRRIATGQHLDKTPSRRGETPCITKFDYVKRLSRLRIYALSLFKIPFPVDGGC